MRSIPAPRLTAELEELVAGRPPGKAPGYQVKHYRDLLSHVARLSYLNKDYLLFFRGQSEDYRNKAGASTLYPAIYRGDRVPSHELELRFDVLRSAGRRLCHALENANTDGYKEVRRRRYICWSILQHYQVCPTPLLDLTHSLRVACTFAYLDSDSDRAYLFCLGLPYVTNRVSINSEHDVVNVRLLSICPPDAMRPYYQDGYMAGTDEVTTDFDSKDELDFNNRLIAKFELPPPRRFWSPGFGAIPKSYLYPRDDRMQEICTGTSAEIGSEIESGRLGDFLREWTNLESKVLTAARHRKERVFSLLEATQVLQSIEAIPRDFAEQLDGVRRVRNRAVHEPEKVSAAELAEARGVIEELLGRARQLDL